MQASNIPVKFPIPWGNSAGAGYIRQVPTASQIGIQSGAASLTDGFPPLNALPLASGGVPPFMQDTNGILKQSTQWLQWMQAGGPIAWDSTFSSEIGGYPSGAIVASVTTPGLWWFSTVDNNITNPDSGGAGWTNYAYELQPRGGEILSSSGTFTVPAAVFIITVEAWAGGGGGGRSSGPSSGGTSGGGGAYAWFMLAVTPGQTLAVTVGAAGSGDSGSGAGTGGTTSIGSYCILNGGGGGVAGIGGFDTIAGSGGTGAISGVLSGYVRNGSLGSLPYGIITSGGNLSIGAPGGWSFGGSIGRVSVAGSITAVAGTEAISYGCGGGGGLNGGGGASGFQGIVKITF